MSKKAYVAGNVLGLFAFTKEGELLVYEAFPRDTKEISEKLRTYSASTLEGKRIIEKLSGYECIFEDARVTNPAGEFLVSKLDGILKELDVSREEYENILREVSISTAKSEMKEAFGREDGLIIQAAEALADVDESLNILSERIREWYSLHFPELDKVEDHEKYARLLREFGSRERFKASSEFRELAATSAGAEIGEKDSNILSKFAEQVCTLYEFRSELDGYISYKMQEVAPNLSSLAGALVGAKLISLAGGLEKLARMPGSRIQVIGAEKALFRHLRKKGTPPKHGAIFQHPLIKTAPWWQRGRIARSFAGKIAIAARADAYSKAYIADELKDALAARVAEVRKLPEPKRMRIIRRERPQGRKNKRKKGRKWSK
ncbi:MAG: hypothetical protein V3T58_06440 [Candidatus Hydrothermarchaeales archaeon]